MIGCSVFSTFYWNWWFSYRSTNCASLKPRYILSSVFVTNTFQTNSFKLGLWWLKKKQWKVWGLANKVIVFMAAAFAVMSLREGKIQVLQHCCSLTYPGCSSSSLSWVCHSRPDRVQVRAFFFGSQNSWKIRDLNSIAF